MNASAEAVLGHLVRQDTALAFNISEGDVAITGISQVGPSTVAGARASSCAPSHAWLHYRLLKLREARTGALGGCVHLCLCSG